MYLLCTTSCCQYDLKGHPLGPSLTGHHFLHHFYFLRVEFKNEDEMFLASVLETRSKLEYERPFLANIGLC